jgi:heme o synthase
LSDQARSLLQIPKDLIELTKPRLSSLVVITGAGGWLFAPMQANTMKGIYAILGTTITVGAANSLNNYLEREGDKRMQRTQSRPLPMGRLSPNIALAFGLLLTLISIPMLTLLANPKAGLLAGIALVVYVLVYTPMKRKSSAHTLVGAIPGAMPPLIGWVAATNEIGPGGLLLFAILFLWQIPHSLAIAIYRKTEYESAGIIVLPINKGENYTRSQMLVYTMMIFPLPLLLALTGTTGLLTAAGGTLLGGWWLWLAFDGFRRKLGAKWARNFFLYSLIYLSGLFGIMGIDLIIGELL